MERPGMLLPTVHHKLGRSRAQTNKEEKYIWVKTTRMDIMQNSGTICPTLDFEYTNLKTVQTKVKICSALFGL